MTHNDTVLETISRLTAEECENIFYSIRWPAGLRCLKCNVGPRKIYRVRRTGLCRYYCPGCKIWWNDFTGTIFAGRRLALRQWFTAIYLFLECGETAREVARKIKVNRHTAEAIRKLIGKDEPWCRLVVGKIARTTGKKVVSLMSFEEAQGVLGTSRRTIYRLIAAGALSAIKVGGRWRFRAEDIQKYLTSKISRYGTTATGEYVYFRETVLDKYLKDRTKYYLQQEAYQGWVGSKQDYHDIHTLKSLQRRTNGIKTFDKLHYRRVITPEGHHALAVRHQDYQQLPTEEYVHWSNFIIHPLRKSV